jgi:gliding motility-associated-like protein
MKRVLALCLIVGMSSLMTSQIALDQNYTIEEYVNDILLGTGVEATNITYTGSMVQLGFLTGTEGTIFPIEQGLVLSTEHAENITVFDFLGQQTIPNGEEVAGDPDLLTIANSVPPLIGQNFTVGSVNDVCILEFDFIATGDTVSFNYSFGSDEYLGYVNTTFNDIFAFFLSGPGLTGPYNSPAGFPDGAINIAGVPNADPPLPITISSVNDVLNQEYYVNNPDPNIDIAINGFTQMFVASSQVQCGETYHIKLAIADGTDSVLESVVVLEAGSFSSNAVVQIDLTIDVGGPDANTIYEDCGEAVLTFARPEISILEIEEMVIITYEGDAINGIDYTELPDTVIFAPGQSEVSFPVSAIIDGIAEGAELVHFNILNLAACNGAGVTSSFEFYISDFPDPMVVEGFDEGICLNASIDLEPFITGGYGNFSYEWSTTETTGIINVSPGLMTTYNVIVSDTCGMPSDDADFIVTVFDLPNLSVILDPEVVVVECAGIEVVANAEGGDGDFSYVWTNENGQALFGWQNTLWMSLWSNAEEINVEVTDGCGFTATTNAPVTYIVPDLIVNVPSEIEVLCNSQYTIEPDVTGEGLFYYNWYVNGAWVDWQPTYTANGVNDVTITVEVSDNCTNSVSQDIDIVIVSPELVLSLIDQASGSCIDVFQFEPSITGGIPGYSYSWSDDGNNLGTDENLTFQSNQSTTVFLNVSDNCGQSAQDSIIVTIESIPPVIDLGEDIYASCVDLTQMDATVTDGIPDFDFTWTIEGEVVSNSSSLSHQSYETDVIYCKVTDACGNEHTDSLIYNIPDIPVVVELTADTSICFGSAVVLHTEAFGGEGGFTYFWPHSSSAEVNVQVDPATPTMYEVIATDMCGTLGFAEMTVDVQDVNADFEMNFYTESEVQFVAITDPDPCDGCSYYWDFGDGTNSTEFSPIKGYDGLGQYTAWLTVTNELGCSDIVHHLVLAPLTLYVPNAFTPDGDGINDNWFVVGDGIVEYELFIFDRWGQAVWHSTDLNDIWLGGTQAETHYVPNGMYSYLIKYSGVNYDSQKVSGSITILR